MPTIRQAIGLVILAIGLAVALRVLLPVPVISLAAIFALFAALDIARESHIGGGARTAWSGTRRLVTFLAGTAVAVVIFTTFRLLAGGVLGIWPVDTYEQWGRYTGLEMIRERYVPLEVLWDVLFALVVGYWVYLASRRSGMARTTVGTTLVVSLLVLTFIHSRPLTAEALQNRVPSDEEMAKMVEALSLSPAAAPALPDYPLCADTQDGVELTLEKPKATLQLHPNCWSGWVTLPVDVDFDVRNPGGLELLYWDGRRFAAGATETAWLGNIRNSTFRLRGDGVAAIAVKK